LPSAEIAIRRAMAPAGFHDYLATMSPYDAQEARSAATRAPAPLVDGFGRAVTYLRLSVTDRCDLRCVYCMAERMTFLPRAEVLSLNELEAVASAFIDLGVRKLRLTGGEPLVRRGAIDLIERLARRLKSGDLDELTLTSNGTRLAEFADDLARLGVRRINVSLDTLKPDVFARLTRGGDVAKVLDGVAAAQAAGLSVKINTVALAHDNAEEIPDLIRWAHGQGMDLTLIETMPLGDTGEDRAEQFLSLAQVRRTLDSFWTLTDLPLQTGGPARYVRIAETGGRLGLITPLTHNFCEGCNRVRLTCTGVLHSCLGREDAADLRAILRSGAGPEALKHAIRAAIDAKPQGHDFHIERGVGPSLARHMSTTGG
jgi:GTP 3',8-cyclase